MRACVFGNFLHVTSIEEIHSWRVRVREVVAGDGGKQVVQRRTNNFVSRTSRLLGWEFASSAAGRVALAGGGGVWSCVVQAFVGEALYAVVVQRGSVLCFHS